MGAAGQGLIHTTRTAFMGGQREALLIGAISLLLGVGFLLFRGGAPVPEVAAEPEWDEPAAELELAG